MASDRPERAAVAWLAAMVLLPFLWFWLRGLTPYWSDLTYIHHTWKSVPAQLNQAGRLPLWNPYIYFGMPMSGAMQGGLFYPGTLPFFIWGFATATALFHAVQYFLAAWLTYIWLRQAGLNRAAAICGGLTYALCGGMWSRMHFLNHLAVLSLSPALLIFFRRPGCLALALALSYLAGYPAILAGWILWAWALRAVLGGLRRGGAAALWTWAAAGAASLAMSAAQLLPAVELVRLCRRAGGMDLAETLQWGYAPSDLVQWISPLLVPWSRFDPAVEWWKCAYLGLAGCVLAVIGGAFAATRRRWGLAVLLGVVVLIILGGTNTASLAVWSRFPPLRYVRYPGNMGYLAFPILALLVGMGAQRVSRPLRWAAVITMELAAYGLARLPLAPRGIFTSAGPLVRRLQETMGPGRYLLAPTALEEHKGFSVPDWKWRLYGLTNAPFRLPSGGNFGEPLVPRDTYAFMNFLYSRPGAAAAARWFPWSGVEVLLTSAPVVGAPAALAHEGRVLWEVYRAQAWRAHWHGEAAGRAIPPDFADDPPPQGFPVPLRWPREDRFFVGGVFDRAGWVYIAEPYYPGWRADLWTPDGRRPVAIHRALRAFMKIPVPAGRWRCEARYSPWSFTVGAWLSVLAVVGMAAYWYNRLPSQAIKP